MGPRCQVCSNSHHFTTFARVDGQTELFIKVDIQNPALNSLALTQMRFELAEVNTRSQTHPIEFDLALNKRKLDGLLRLLQFGPPDLRTPAGQPSDHHRNQ